MRKYREYTDEDVINVSREVFSIAGLLKKLNLKPAGGNYVHIKKTLQRLNVDTSHWTGQSWNRNKQLKDWSDYTRIARLKLHLIRKCGHECQRCKCKIWESNKIPLEVHHRDGDRTNNEFDNLQLLCCNCHALTNNWRNKKCLCDETGST